MSAARRCLSLVAIAAVTLAVAAVAAAATYQVTATVGVSGTTFNEHVHLKIDLNGRTAYNRAVTSPACGLGCTTAGLGGSKVAVRVLDLSADGSPDVVLGLFSGGAHCCFVDQVYALNPATKTFVRSEHAFLDSNPKITTLTHGGPFVFLSADARIAESGFTDYADSGAPVQIFAFSAGRFRDVTDQYRSRVVTDAANWLRAYHHHESNGRGLIAAWAADEERLGNGTLVNATLATALKHHQLGLPEDLSGSSPQAFIAQLHRLLAKLGYTH